MNSDDKRSLAPSWMVFIAASLAFAWLAGCADRGPTNLYSQTFFGETQAGAQFQVWRVDESTLIPASNPSPGLDGYIVWLKDTGQGGTIGPIQATLVTAANPCAMPVTYGASVATAIFGNTGQVINPGDILRGQAVGANGSVQNGQYSYEVSYNSVSCVGSSVNFTVNAMDSHGSSWTSSFSGVTQ
jgi:hypothetical protein